MCGTIRIKVRLGQASEAHRPRHPIYTSKLSTRTTNSQDTHHSFIETKRPPAFLQRWR